MHTSDQICCEDKNILQDVCSFGGFVEYTAAVSTTYKQSTVALDIFLDSLLPLLFANFVYRFDALQLIIGEVAGPDSAIPWYLLMLARPVTLLLGGFILVELECCSEAR